MLSEFETGEVLYRVTRYLERQLRKMNFIYGDVTHRRESADFSSEPLAKIYLN